MEKRAEEKAKKSRIEFLIALALLLVLIAAIVVIAVVLPKAKNKASSNESARQLAEMPFEVPGFTILDEIDGTTFDNGLKVLCAGKYSGAFLEDGEDNQVTDVLTLVVQNTSSTLIEYGVIELSCGKQTATFEFSGLPVGSAVLVQEKNKLIWKDGMKHSDFSCPACALPGTIVLDFGEDFQIFTDDGVINIQNISDKDYTEDVSVFYKNYEYGLFMGGITYRARFTGGVPAGEFSQSMQKHYYYDTSTILYMSYAK